QLKRNLRYAQELEHGLQVIPAIREVSVTPSIGSLVVQFDSAATPSPGVWQSLASALGVAPQTFDGVTFDLVAPRPQQDEQTSLWVSPSEVGLSSDGIGSLADTSIVHSLTGRVRLRVPALKTSYDLPQGIERILCDQPGVTEVDISTWSASVTISYDPS